MASEVAFCPQTEGEALSRKNGELEAAVRKLRVAAKEHEAERERLQARLKQQDELLSRERERHERAGEAAARQVALFCTPGCCWLARWTGATPQARLQSVPWK